MMRTPSLHSLKCLSSHIVVINYWIALPRFLDINFAEFARNLQTTQSCLLGSKTSLDRTRCDLSVVSDLETVRTPRIPVPLPDISFNRDHFHHLVSLYTRSTSPHTRIKDYIQLCYLWSKDVPKTLFQEIPHITRLLL